MEAGAMTTNHQDRTGTDGLMRIIDVQTYLSVSRPTVLNLLAAGTLSKVKIGRAVRVPRRDVVAYANALLRPSG
jgi:excisionase family DNA binding protein